MKTSDPIQQQKSSTAVPPAGARDLLSPLTFCILAVALVAGVFAIYSPALDFQFVLDDHHFVSDPRLQSPGHFSEYFTSYTWSQIRGGPVSFYRPLFVVWLRLNFFLNEMSSWGWHLLSVAKHVLVAVLLGWLAWKLLRDRVAALIAGTLFVLHPAQTESVAWVSVPDPLMAAAALATLLLYLRYAERPPIDGQPRAGESGRKSTKQVRNKPKADSHPSVAWLIASATACLAALMAKETAVVLLPVLFALTLMSPFGNRAGEEEAKGEAPKFGSRLVSAFRETLPFLAVTVVYLLLRLQALGGRLSPATQDLPWRTVLLSWPATLWFYVKVLFWPVRQRAFADPTLAETFSLRGVVLPGLGVCCAVAILVGACVWARRTARRSLADRDAAGVECALVLGSFILVLPILLTLNLNALNPGDFLHGRYTYLPLAGLMLLLAAGWRLAMKGRIVLLSAAAFVAVGFSVLTVKQEGPWKDDLTIFTAAHESAPRNDPVAQSLVRAHVQVAIGLDEAGRCDEAILIFKQAIQQYPDDWFAWAGLGECLFKLNDLPGAEQSLRRASELSGEPRVKEVWQGVRAKMGLPSTPPD
jgi:hypothetical protein